MAFKVQDIKSALQFGGARPSHFNVTLQLPTGIQPAGVDTGTFKQKISFLCSAASLPPSSIAPIEVSYFGRKIKVAGTRTFPEWTVTIINDEDFLLRNAFEGWMEAINGRSSNLRNSGATAAPESYKTDGVVTQFGKADETVAIRKYKFVGLFPSEVSPIELSWGTDNEIETFTVQFQYDYWENAE